MGKYKLTVGSISDIKAEDNTVVAIGSVEYKYQLINWTIKKESLRQVIYM